MTAVAIGILALYMIDLLAFIMIVKNEKRIDRLESSEKAEEYTLKPCPFCGGEAALERVRGDDHYSYVYCKKCHCSTNLLVCSTQYDCDKLVAKMWNKRVGEKNADD